MPAVSPGSSARPSCRAGLCCLQKTFMAVSPLAMPKPRSKLQDLRQPVTTSLCPLLPPRAELLAFCRLGERNSFSAHCGLLRAATQSCVVAAALTTRTLQEALTCYHWTEVTVQLMVTCIFAIKKSGKWRCEQQTILLTGITTKVSVNLEVPLLQFRCSFAT